MTVESFLESKEDGVFYIGHASALVKMGKGLFLCDPMWDHKPYGEYWDFHPSQINCNTILSQVTGVIISHIHEDHVCLPILKSLPDSVPIYVMHGRKPLEDKLKEARKVVYSLHPYCRYGVKGDVDLYFVPHAFNSIDSSVFMLSRNYNVYVGSDNFLDKDLLQRVKVDIDERIHVAMVPYAFVHWYPFLLKNITDEERTKEINRLNKQSIDQAKMFIDAFKPAVVIPFGNNIVYSERDHILNQFLAQPTDLVSCPVVTGDHVIGEHPYMEKKPYQRYGGRYFPDMDFNVDVEPTWLASIQQRLAGCVPFSEPHELIVNSVVIDLHTLRVYVRNEDGEAPSTRFNFDRVVFEQWASGAITFEQAIGTRRFECVRTPNVYNLAVFELMNNYL